MPDNQEGTYLGNVDTGSFYDTYLFLSMFYKQDEDAGTVTITYRFYANKQFGQFSGAQLKNVTVDIYPSPGHVVGSTRVVDIPQISLSGKNHYIAGSTVTYNQNKNVQVDIVAIINADYYEDSVDFQFNKSGRFHLPIIYGSSKITSAADIELGNNCNIKWTPDDATFTFKLKFALGDWSTETGFISPNSISEYTYTATNIPITVASKLPKSKTGKMLAQLSTYSNGVQIGKTESKDFTVTVPASCAPVITDNKININPINTGGSKIDGWEVFVAGITKAKLTANATAQYGATISKYKISNGYDAEPQAVMGALDYTSGALSKTGRVTFIVKAIDTRNMESAPASTTIDVYSSANPTIGTFTARRNADDETHVTVNASWGCSVIGDPNQNSATAKLSYKETTAPRFDDCSDVIKNGSSTSLSNSFATSKAYNVKLTVEDKLGKKVSRDIILQTPFVLMDFRSGGKGLGIGGVATQDGLEIMLDTTFVNCKIKMRDDQGTEMTLEDYIKQVVRSMQT